MVEPDKETVEQQEGPEDMDQEEKQSANEEEVLIKTSNQAVIEARKHLKK